MRSRRTILASLGTVGVASVGGCSALPFGNGDEERADVSLSTDTVEPLSWPDSPFPVTVPSTLADAHHERARELLAAVPSDPSVPNGAIAEELRSDRERAVAELEKDVEESWPTDRLSRWRSRLNTAAAVRGAYRAASGEDDGDTLRERRRAVREDLGSFVADHDYRAATVLEAVLAYAPVEELVADCRRQARPNPAYPSDPIARPFDAGDAVGRVERAHATLTDAQRLREVYLSERQEPPSQWSAVIDASDRLRYAVGESRSTVDDFLDVDDPPFDADLDGTPGWYLFDTARRQVELRGEDVREQRDDGAYAQAVIEAGQTLAAVEALRTTIEGIQNGAYQESVTEASVSRTADRAREAIIAIEGSENPRLAVQIGQLAFSIFDYVPERIEERYADPTRVQGELAWVELYARAVPAATEFVIERLE